jgi:hypothetical protein
VTFSYFPRAADERSAWLAAWDDEKTLPGLVRVRVEFPRESGRSWSELVLRPMVDVPPMTGG